MNGSTALRRIAQSTRQACKQYHVPFRIAQPGLVPRRHLTSTTTSISQWRKQWPAPSLANQIRYESRAPSPLTDRPDEQQENAASKEEDGYAARKAQEPAYELVCPHLSQDIA